MTALSAAQFVPQNAEKLPLYHWQPGARLLVVGSRDGALFDPADSSEEQSFQRPLSESLLVASHQRLGTDGLCAAWNTTLEQPGALRLMRDVSVAQSCALTVITSGYGDAQLLAEIAPSIHACVLLVSAESGPLCADILRSIPHVEVVIGMSADLNLDTLPDLSEAKAVHVVGRRLSDLIDPAWYDQVRAWLPDTVPCYDDKHQHSICSCGETLVWRTAGRSRLDAIEPGGSACTACGKPFDISWR